MAALAALMVFGGSNVSAQSISIRANDLNLPSFTTLFDGTTLPSGSREPAATLYRKIRVTEGGTITIRLTLNNPLDANADGTLDTYTVNIAIVTNPGGGVAGPNNNVGNFTIRPGSEIAAAGDATLSTATVTFSPGNYTQDVTLTAVQDTTVEFDEDVLISVSALVNTSNNNQSLFNGVPIAWAVVTIPYQDTPPGAVDSAYASESALLPQPGANNTVNAVVLDSIGRAVIVGDFTAYSASPRNRIARVTTNGVNDSSFDPVNGANAAITSVAIYTNGVNDGKIFIGGGFSSFNGTSLNSVARLLATGAVDSSFNPGSGANGPARAVAIDANGKTIVAGEFTLFNGTARNRIVRLNADGSVDTAFAPGTGADNTIYAVVIQADGKIVIGGDFVSYNGSTRSRIARLNTDGSLDFTFDPGSGFDNTVFALTLDPSQRILVGGAFAQAQGVARRGVTRLTTTGAADSTFNPGVGTDDTVYAIQDITLGATRAILIGGVFTKFNTTHRRHIARLFADGTSDGSLDTSWMDRAYCQLIGPWSMATNYANAPTFTAAGVNTGTATFTTAANHGLSVTDQVVFQADPTPGRQRLPDGLLGGTIYYVITTPAANQFQVSLTLNGPSVTLFNAGDPDALTHSVRKLSSQSSFVTAIAAQADFNVVIGGKFTE
ncbi:MAG: hypothetical protein ACKODH_12215, partial [Limisphaerales bacterium]